MATVSGCLLALVCATMMLRVPQRPLGLHTYFPKPPDQARDGRFQGGQWGGMSSPIVLL